MRDDPIVAEIRKVRDAHASQFNHDLDAIYRDLKAREQASGRQYVQYQPRPYEPRQKTTSPQTR